MSESVGGESVVESVVESVGVVGGSKGVDEEAVSQ